MIETKNTSYGFSWGPAKIERGFSDQKAGWATLILTTAKHKGGLQIYVTKTGKVRIHGERGEWMSPKIDTTRGVRPRADEDDSPDPAEPDAVPDAKA